MSTFKVPTAFTAVDKFSQTMKKMQESVKSFVNRSEADIARFERRWRSIGQTSLNVAKKSAIVGAAILAPLVVAANDAIKFEDNMADIGKTTGLTGKTLDSVGKSILNLSLDTRTSIEELQKIGSIAGSKGIVDPKEIIAFTDAANKFNVALGSDFGGGVEEAAKQVGGLHTLFRETRRLSPADAITKAGSAINALSAKGVQVPELNEFMLRVGQLPDAIKPTIQNTAAIGAVMNKAGITAEIASRAFGDILLTGAANLPKFAKQMKLTEKEASNLINSDPTTFAIKFAKSLDGLSAEQLAGTLKKLKLTDAGAIKVVGALGSSIDMLAEFQNISNTEFAKGTSLLNEYNTKNNTTKGNIQKAMNNFRALSITIGTELLPVINDLIRTASPMIKQFLQWSKDNPKTLKTIVGLTAGLAALSFIVSGVSSAIFIFSHGMLLLNNITKLVTAAQWLWNAAMFANPIGLIVLAIAAAIAVITVMIVKWNEWGAALAFVIGPLGIIVSLIQSFRRNWEFISDSFSNNGLIAGFKAIGVTIVDALLMPLEQLLKIIGEVTNSDWAAKAAKDLHKIRGAMGLNITTDESGKRFVHGAGTSWDTGEAIQKTVPPIANISLPENLLSGQSGGASEVLNPKMMDHEIIREQIRSQTFNSRLLIQDETGRGKLESDDPNLALVPARVGSTMQR